MAVRCKSLPSRCYLICFVFIVLNPSSLISLISLIMARVIYGMGIDQIIGKVGSIVHQSNASGFIVRSKPLQRTSKQQQLLREPAIFAAAVRLWSSLSLSQRSAWQAYAIANSFVNVWGRAVKVSGYSVFLSQAMYAISCGQQPLIDVPVFVAPEFGRQQLAMIYEGLLFYYDPMGASDYTCWQLIYTTPPSYNSAPNCIRGLRLTSVFAPSSYDGFDLTEDYKAAHNIIDIVNPSNRPLYIQLHLIAVSPYNYVNTAYQSTVVTY